MCVCVAEMAVRAEKLSLSDAVPPLTTNAYTLLKDLKEDALARRSTRRHCWLRHTSRKLVPVKEEETMGGMMMTMAVDMGAMGEGMVEDIGPERCMAGKRGAELSSMPRC